jgi:hypothetical protein
MATAQFGQLAVEFEACQAYGDATRTVAFCAPIQLSEVDLVAALWVHVEADVEPQALSDLGYVRDLVADAIVNWGLAELAEARIKLAGLVAGTAEHARSQRVRTAVRAAFAPVLAAPAGRALVGVA